MVKIDGKTVVSIVVLGEHDAYQYALIVRPFYVDRLTPGGEFFHDEFGQEVQFDHKEYGIRYVQNDKNLMLLPYENMEELYGYFADSEWVITENTPFSEPKQNTRRKIA